MKRAIAGEAEEARLAALGSYAILDTPAERGFDDIVLLASRICQTPVALVSLVASDRQWFKARVGFDACETPLSQSVCAHTLQRPGLLIIPDLTADPRTRENRLVTEPPHIRFYAGARLETPEGVGIGALCVIDTEPRPEGLSSDQAEALEALARQVMVGLELRRSLLSAEARIAAQVREQRRTWQLSPDLLGILNDEGVFETTNPAWQNILGWSKAEIASTAFFDLLHPEDLAANRTAWAYTLLGQPIINLETRCRRTDGTYIWLSWVAVPEGDKVYCSGRDITADKERAAALRESATALLSERETAELRDQFIAVLGHDLRNPIASIDAGVQMLSRESVSDKGIFALRHMQRSVRRIASLIDNLLDFARGRLGGGLSLDQSIESHVSREIEQVITELEIVWPDRAIEKHIAITQPVCCDSTRIGQLLSNILGNALTYGAQDRPIRVEAFADREIFELSVSNGGPAIPEATLDRLFQPFFRGAARRNQQGLGLGLYIVSEIARAHGGEMEVQSTDAETRFTFKMPNKNL